MYVKVAIWILTSKFFKRGDQTRSFCWDQGSLYSSKTGRGGGLSCWPRSFKQCHLHHSVPAMTFLVPDPSPTLHVARAHCFYDPIYPPAEEETKKNKCKTSDYILAGLPGKSPLKLSCCIPGNPPESGGRLPISKLIYLCITFEISSTILSLFWLALLSAEKHDEKSHM